MNWACALPCALDFAPIRPSTTARCTRSAHEMATFTRLKSGHWRVQVRRKKSYASETLLRREDGRRLATATERRIDLGQSPLKPRQPEPTTSGPLGGPPNRQRRVEGRSGEGRVDL